MEIFNGQVDEQSLAQFRQRAVDTIRMIYTNPRTMYLFKQGGVTITIKDDLPIFTTDDGSLIDILNFTSKMQLIQLISGELDESEKRTRERTKIINAGDVFLEHYMRRMMHPSRLTALAADADLDVDEFMTRYVESL